MIHPGILIRTKEELQTSNEHVKRTLLKECKKKDKGSYPIVYQYRTSNSKVHLEDEINKNELVGYMSNIREDNDGNVVCDVSINDFMYASNQFNNRIDNVMVELKDGVGIIHKGIIYNTYVKSMVDKLKSSGGGVVKSSASPIPDLTPLDNNINPLMDPKVHESIMKDFPSEERGED